jgi:hypothetical protein
MSRPSTGKTPEHIRNANAARVASVKRLIELHKDEWKLIYDEEASSRGVKTRKAKTT